MVQRDALAALRVRIRVADVGEAQRTVEYSSRASVKDLAAALEEHFDSEPIRAITLPQLGQQLAWSDELRGLPLHHGLLLQADHETSPLPFALAISDTDRLRLVHESGQQLGHAWPVAGNKPVALRLDLERRLILPAAMGEVSDLNVAMADEPNAATVEITHPRISIALNGRAEPGRQAVVTPGSLVKVTSGSVSWELRLWLASDHEDVRLTAGFVAYRARPMRETVSMPPPLEATLASPTAIGDVEWDWADAVALPAAMMVMYCLLILVTRIPPYFLIIGIVAPLVSVYVRYRRAHRDHERRIAAHNDEIVAIDRSIGVLHKQVRAEVDAVASRNPDFSTLSEAAIERAPLLWSRQPAEDQFLKLVVGEGDYQSPSTIEVSGHITDPRVPVWQEDIETVRRLRDAPIEVDIAGTDFAVIGSQDVLLAYVSDLLVRSCVLHSPADLTLSALLPADPQMRRGLDWLAWMPHARSTSPIFGADRIIWGGPRIREFVSRAADFARDDILAEDHSVVVAHESAGVDIAELERLKSSLQEKLTLVWIGHSPSRIPGLFRNWFEVANVGDGAPLGITQRPGGTALHWVPAVSDAVRDVALAVSSLLDETQSTTSQSVALEVPLGKLVQRREDPQRSPADSLVAILGESAHGLFELDLEDQGPHVLVAGTTGSGKSELLRTLIVSLAARYSPHDLALILIDFKGGASLGDLAGATDCEPLPHVIGSVTNLSGPDVERLIKFLRAEVARRQRELAPYNGEYSRHYSNAQQRLPRLVVVIDEFAGFMEDQSANREKAILELAARGRSLGIHLVIATQSPRGVVTGQLTANVNARIALRMLSDADSLTVIDSPRAATIQRRLKGRAFARLETGEVVEFQSGHSAAVTLVNRRDVPVRLLDLLPHAGDFASSTGNSGHDEGDRPTESAAAADPHDDGKADSDTPKDPPKNDATILREALAGLSRPKRDVQPRLLDSPLAGLEAPTVEKQCAKTAALPGVVLPLGIEDVPQKQEQIRFDIALRLGALLIKGLAQSGRTFSLRVAAEAFRRLYPEGSSVVVDAGGGDLAAATQWADWALTEPTRGELAHLMEQLDHTYGAPCTPTLVLIDRMDTVLSLIDVDRFVRLVANGGRSGIHIVATWDDRLSLDPHVRRAFMTIAELIDGYQGVAERQDNGNLVLFSPPSDEVAGRPIPVTDCPEERVYETPARRPLGFAHRGIGRGLDSVAEGSVLVGIDRARYEAVRASVSPGSGLGIAGPPRSGKTMALVSLCERLVEAAGGGRIPIFASDLGQNLPDFLFDARSWLGEAPASTGTDYARALFAEDVLPILAIDEIGRLRQMLSRNGMDPSVIQPFLGALDDRCTAGEIALIASGSIDEFIQGPAVGREVLNYREALLVLQPQPAHLIANIGGVNANQALRLVSNLDAVPYERGEGRFVARGTAREVAVIASLQAQLLVAPAGRRGVVRL